LLDQYQVVRPGEIGSVAEIEVHARARNLVVKQVDLKAQYRSGGSERYLEWVLRLLGLSDEAPVAWSDEVNFTVDVVDSPEELATRLRAEMDKGSNARMTAGYCWPWSDPRADETLVPDVVIGDWKRPWNLRGDRRLGAAAPSAMWATAEGG